MDVFRRTDGSFGFDLFRRDPEDPSGWYSVGHFGDVVFLSKEEAHLAAQDAVPWFEGL